MTYQTVEMGKEQNVYLAYMECFASCVLTYLNINQKDYRKVLLDYWNINYESRTLLSSKNAQQIPLDYFYGIKMDFANGNSELLLNSIREGDSAICLCLASKLDYFPRKYIILESSGFWHSILCYGWNEDNGTFLVSDPVVNEVVELTPEQIMHASAARSDRNELHYFIVKKADASFVEPDIKICLNFSAERNLNTYSSADFQAQSKQLHQKGAATLDKAAQWQIWFQKRLSGLKAWDKFSVDLLDSVEWKEPRREAWVKQNTMTASSIKNMRMKIWEVYRELAALDESQELEGQQQISRISGTWNQFNLLLLKYIHSKEGHLLIPALNKQVEKIKYYEMQFLTWLNVIVGKGDNYADLSG